jgi:hypothetical protein
MIKAALTCLGASAVRTFHQLSLLAPFLADCFRLLGVRRHLLALFEPSSRGAGFLGIALGKDGISIMETSSSSKIEDVMAAGHFGAICPNFEVP